MKETMQKLLLVHKQKLFSMVLYSDSQSVFTKPSFTLKFPNTSVNNYSYSIIFHIKLLLIIFSVNYNF